MSSFTTDNYINIGLLIITLVTTLAPITTAIINNIHDTKIRRLEANTKIKQEILKEFAKNINYLNGYDSISIEFYQSLNLLNIYFKVDNDLIEKIMHTKYDDNISFQKEVNLLMNGLAKQVNAKS